MALLVLSTLLMILLPLLEVHYWVTRASTAGVALTAARIAAAARLVRDGVEIARIAQTQGDMLSVAVVYTVGGLKDVAMASVLWTLGRHARWRWVPVLRSRALSHRERASERLDARTLAGAKYAVSVQPSLVASSSD